MRPRIFLSLSLFFAVGLSSSTLYSAEKPQEIFYTVKRVVDGDTVILSTGEKVRLTGIDTPESRNNRKLKRDAERVRKDMDTILALGKRSAQFTRSLVEGKRVRLEPDVETKDRFGRTLAYVFIPTEIPTGAEYARRPNDGLGILEDGLKFKEAFVNATLVYEGYAQVYTILPNVKYKDLFLRLQKEAREAKRGLWRETPIKT